MPPAPHSPAPWTAKGTRVSAADGSDVCDICPHDDSQTFDANRHLITASPLMLEALEAVLNHVLTRISSSTEHSVREAIRKAKGL